MLCIISRVDIFGGILGLHRLLETDEEGVKILLARGEANPHKPNIYVQTPLLHAAKNGWCKC